MRLLGGNILTSIVRWDRRVTTCEAYSTAARAKRDSSKPKEIIIRSQTYPADEWTNVTPKILSLFGKNLHVAQYHPLSLLRQRIVKYFYSSFYNRIGSPVFSIYDNISPVVTVGQNFDSLLVPKDHPSRSKTDCYYINQDTLLRAHTTAHQAELISMGLNNFIVIGDVYRRDDIDKTHYPVFHQVDAVRLCTVEEVFQNVQDGSNLKIFEHKGTETAEKQACHTLEAVKVMEHELKNTLTGLASTIFGRDVQYRWVEQYFPFTHPSWELEIYHKDEWIEIVGCGVMRQEIVEKSGATDRIGWAFGLGLERLAMCLYGIDDIRLFWSRDSGFLNQFKVDDPEAHIHYKPVSVYPQCTNDLSFWLPENGQYSPNDLYDIVREIAGDMVEQIHLKDQFFHPQKKRYSHCYGIVYRHMERTLTQNEVNNVHSKIAKAATDRLNVTIR